MYLVNKLKSKLSPRQRRGEKRNSTFSDTLRSESSITAVTDSPQAVFKGIRPTVDAEPPKRTPATTTAINGLRTALDIGAAASDGFGPLKSALGGIRAILQSFDQYTVNQEKVLAMVKRLESFEISGRDDAVDPAESERRGKLRRTLVKISRELERIREQNQIERFANGAQDESQIAGYVEDIRDALTDYQVSLQKDLLRIAHDTMEAAHHTLLYKLRRAKGAAYSAENHQKCLRGTREQVLRDIIRWLEDPHDRRVYWLNGIAGTGKSTISQTFAEYCFAEGLLGASFFCSRDVSDRSDIRLIFPTLSFQLASRFPEFRAHLLETMKSTPDVAHESLSLQLEELLIKPLQSTGISTTIVVDALDECKDEEPSSIILSLLAKHIDDIPNVKFFITGRPESNIRAGFRMKGLKDTTEVLVLHQVDSGTVGHDIRTYLKYRFSQVVENRSDMEVNEPWPSPVELEVAVQRCSGLFIYAFTTVEFVASSNDDPRERLHLITSIPTDTSFEGRKGIDKLYTKILHEVFAKEEPSFFPRLRMILGTIVLLFNPLSRVHLAKILGWRLSQVSSCLRSLHSLLLIPESDSAAIRVFHKSFSDYITDAERCMDVRHYVDPSVQHAKLAIRCLELMVTLLKRNICDLPRYSLNRDVEDLGERRKERIGDALEYACMSWAKHLVLASTEETYVKDILPLLRILFDKDLLAWLEVLSVFGDARSSVYSLHDVQNWLMAAGNPDSELMGFAQDSERFARRSLDVINESAAHIYDSALYWLPESSLVRIKYHHQGASEIKSLNAVDPAWGGGLFSIQSGHQMLSTLFSHKGDVIACCGAANAGLLQFTAFVKLFEVTTGICLATLHAGKDLESGGSSEGYSDSIAFSLDDSLLAVGSGDGLVTVFDVRTASLVRDLKSSLTLASCVEFSPDGSSVVAGGEGVIYIWHLESGESTCVIEGDFGTVNSLKWLDEAGPIFVGSWSGAVESRDPATGKCLHAFNPGYTVVCAPEISPDASAFASTTEQNQLKIYATGTGESLHTIDISAGTSCLSFSPNGKQIAYGTPNKLFVWDFEEERLVQEIECSRLICVTFSSDGRQIAAALGSDSVSLWQLGETVNNNLVSNLHSDQVGRVFFAHEGHLAASASDDRTIRLWDIPTFSCLHTFSGHPGQIYSLAISVDASMVASGSEDKLIRIWSCKDYSEIKTLQAPGPIITALQFSINGKQLVSVSHEGIMTLWDTKTWEKIEDVDLRIGGLYIRNKLSTGDLVTTPHKGRIGLPLWYLQLPVPGLPPSLFQYNSNWVTLVQSGRKDQRILWFPVDSACYGHDWHGTKLIFGTRRGRIVLMDFKDVV